MAKNKPEPAGEPGQQTIEDLQSRYAKLHKAQIEAERDLKNAQDRLDQLKREAREEFGTDDLAELQRKLEQMQKDNEEKRGKYQADLDEIEEKLAAVQKQFDAVEKAAIPSEPS
jgi:chromosome segregation ATPase